jgi:hypothetical protein
VPTRRKAQVCHRFGGRQRTEHSTARTTSPDLRKPELAVPWLTSGSPRQIRAHLQARCFRQNFVKLVVQISGPEMVQISGPETVLETGPRNNKISSRGPILGTRCGPDIVQNVTQKSGSLTGLKTFETATIEAKFQRPRKRARIA